MSHRVKLSLAMRDKANLKRACRALHIDFQEGPHTVHLYDGDVPGEFSIQLPNWRFRTVIDLKSGEANFDNYNGHWGKGEELHRFAQEYSLQVAENEDSVQDLLMKGWTAARIRQPNGQIDLVIEKE